MGEKGLCPRKAKKIRVLEMAMTVARTTPRDVRREGMENKRRLEARGMDDASVFRLGVRNGS